jgi:hypothetical protein
MKKLKAVAIFISLIGLLCFLLSAYSLFTLENHLQLWDQLQRAGMPMAQKVSLASLRSATIAQAIWFAVIGLLSIVCAVGLFLVKDWARKLWLGVLILLAVISLYWLAGEYLQGLLRGEDVIGYLIIGVIIIAMWLYFTREKTKQFFRRDLV